jgi:exodeoxyribonuclease VII small subunit
MSLTYRQAIEELETILRALETDAVDVDDLTVRVERSAELIRLCRHKLRHAEASLDRVFDTLDDEDAADAYSSEADELAEADDEAPEDDEEADDDREQAGGAGRPNQPSWLF